MSAAEPSRRSFSRIRPFLILLLASAFLLASFTWLWWRDGTEAAQGARTAQSDSLLADLDRRLDALEDWRQRWEEVARRRENQLADLERVHRGLREELLALRERLETLDRSLSALLARHQSSAARAALAELDHLLAAAEIRDRLLFDRQGALALLRAARDLARARSEPLFAELERLIAADLLWLERHHPDPDHAALTRRLDELNALVPALIARDREGRDRPDAPPRGLARLVHIERVGQPTVPLLPEAVARLLLKIELRLLEVAAASADADGFEQVRSRLDQLLRQQFTGSEQERALALLDELAKLRLVPAASFPERARARVRALLANDSAQEAPAEPPAP